MEKTIDRTTRMNVWTEMKESFMEIAKKHGLQGNIMSEPGQFAIRGNFEVTLKDVDPKQEEFNQYARIKDVPASWYGKVFRDGSRAFRVTKIHPNRTKNYIGITNINTGKDFICGIQFVKSRLGFDAL